jgi:hypothetical protein
MVEEQNSEHGQDESGHRTIDVKGTLVEAPATSVIARLTWRERLPD